VALSFHGGNQFAARKKGTIVMHHPFSIRIPLENENQTWAKPRQDCCFIVYSLLNQQAFIFFELIFCQKKRGGEYTKILDW
jgi:hypothetical protein